MLLEQMIEETANRIVVERRTAVETGTIWAPKHQAQRDAQRG
jgi:hypothetical protein